VPEPSRTDPVTLEGHRKVVEMITAKLPAESFLMLLGGGLMMEAGLRHAVTTKDEDLVLLLVEGEGLRVADAAALERLIRELGSTPKVRKDQTNVSCALDTSEGTFLVEFVRGRRGGHGYFISRAVLERVAEISRRDGRLLVPPLEALAFLKAWASVDKAKLLATGRDGRGYHAERQRAFRRDVALIRERVLESRAPDAGVFTKLLEACSQNRARAVRQVLEEAGWNV